MITRADVLKVFRDELDDANIDFSTELRLDSLDRIEMAMAVEELGPIEVTDEMIESYKTVGELCDMLGVTE